MLKQLDPSLWIADQSLKVAGVDLGARMTVVRLPESKLLLHSPIKPAPELVTSVRALGQPAAIVAPNRFHHLFAGAWLEHFPGTPIFVAPGLETKRPDLAIAGILGDEANPIWKGSVEQVAIHGVPLMNEIVFFHAASRTLIVTDIAFHVGPEQPFLTRLLFRVSGAFGRLGPTYLERLLVRDRTACRASLQRVLAWPFERVIVAHGSVLESGGREQFRKGYAWLLDA